jgi:hypothetical protein
VFVRAGTTWTQQAELTATDPSGADTSDPIAFGSAVSVSGDTAVIGTPHKNGNGPPFPGAAYVFVRAGTAWTQQAELAASDPSGYDEFGTSVSVSGDTAVIGASGHAVNGNVPADTGHGASYVIVRVGGAWSQQAELTAADGITGHSDEFGSSVSVNGDTAVVGARFKAVNGHNGQGAAYVFARSSGVWGQQAELTAADGAVSDVFGSSVSISGDNAVIGAPAKAINGQGGQGAVYLFVRSGSAWSQRTEFTAADGVAGDSFGNAVAVSGDTAIIAKSVNTSNLANLAPLAYVQNLDVVTATATVQVNPATAALVVAPTILPVAMAGVVYASPTSTATGGAGSEYTFQQSGLLPDGLTFDPTTARLTGTPSQPGTFPGIVIAASDGHGGSGSRTYTLTVNNPNGVNGLPVPFPKTVYAPPTSKSEPDADNRAFIRGLYHSVLDRDVEPDGSTLTYWENVLNLAKTNPQQLGLPDWADPYLYVAQGFWNSQEHRWREVESYYHDFLGRDLDLSNSFRLSERQYWTNQFLFAGAQEADVVRGFLTSPEYLVKHRADPSLANTLNSDLLRGTASTPDVQTWTTHLSGLDTQRATIQDLHFATAEEYKAQLAANLGALDDEKLKTGVLFDVLASNEYRQAALDAFYLAYLRRPGTAAEEQLWLSQRDSSDHPLTLGTIAELTLASSEYRTNAVHSEV